MTTAKMPAKAQSNYEGFIGGLAIVVILAFVARWLKIQVYGVNLPLGIPGKALKKSTRNSESE